MRRSLLSAVLSLSILFSTLVAAQDASPISCGAVVLQDTKLDSDIGPCHDVGITIGAPNIRLNLNGHTIRGLGGPAGIVNDGHAGVTIENGTIQSFEQGIRLSSVVGNRVSKVTVSSWFFIGILLGDSDNNRIEQNMVMGGLYYGILLGGSHSNWVEGNTVSQMTYEGITILYSDNNQIKKNQVFDSGFGISLNHQTNNNWVEGNTVSDCGIGIIVSFEEYALEMDNTILKNMLIDNGTGIVIGVTGSGTLLEKNTARSNTGNGITVWSAATILTGNTADDNGALGIDAVAGVTDGGGNTAANNGDPRQCVNVVCAKGKAQVIN
jgi:parallel beta-helix repeat protein